ncbi:MAG: DMT family transporter [Chloroflexi bacterium]|nr:DMT family transporter [Chloroflexota bacterium]
MRASDGHGLATRHPQHIRDRVLDLGLEAMFTIGLASAFFGESVGRRVVIGGVVTTGASLLLATHSSNGWGFSWGAIAVAAATFCWATDNNLTAKISMRDPITIAWFKQAVSATVSVSLALTLGKAWPHWPYLLAALGLGAVSYGVSLVFFILAIRGLGSARTGAIFGTAPFYGVVLSAILFSEGRSWVLIPSGIGVALGLWLLLGEMWRRRLPAPPAASAQARISSPLS